MNIGLIGYGAWGRHHADAITETPGVELAAICARSEDSRKAAREKFSKLVDFLKEELKDSVVEVKFSARLTESPCCLVTEGNSLPPHMERLFRAMHQEVPKSRRVLELNPEHPLIGALSELVGAGAESAERAKKYARILLDQALLSEGSPLADTAEYVKSVGELLLDRVRGR